MLNVYYIYSFVCWCDVVFYEYCNVVCVYFCECECFDYVFDGFLICVNVGCYVLINYLFNFYIGFSCYGDKEISRVN